MGDRALCTYSCCPTWNVCQHVLWQSSLYTGTCKWQRKVSYRTIEQTVRIKYIFKIPRAPVQKNCFCLQEYHVGDSEHLWKEDFLAQVMAYCSICSDSDSLSTVQAVFFTKVRQSTKELSDDCRELKYPLIRFRGKIYKVLLFAIGNSFLILTLRLLH